MKDIDSKIKNLKMYVLVDKLDGTVQGAYCTRADARKYKCVDDKIVQMNFAKVVR